MHGSKTQSRDFITQPETEFYTRTLAGAPTFVHIKYWNTYNIFHGYFDLKPIYSKYFHVSHVPTRIGAQPPHRHSTAASEFELRRSVENPGAYCIISVCSLFHIFNHG